MKSVVMFLRFSDPGWWCLCPLLGSFMLVTTMKGSEKFILQTRKGQQPGRILRAIVGLIRLVNPRKQDVIEAKDWVDNGSQL